MATNNPKWWNDEHTSAWERVKGALKRDWEQTKADLSGGAGGRELDQDVGDTVKQMAGKQHVPPPTVPNPPDAGDRNRAVGRDDDWDRVEGDYRYGVGARHMYGRDGADWDDRVESKLKEEWGDLKSGRTWDEAKNAVRRGWDKATK